MKKAISILMLLCSFVFSVFAIDFKDAGTERKVGEQSFDITTSFWFIVNITTGGYDGNIYYEFTFNDRYGKDGNDFYVKKGTKLEYSLLGNEYSYGVGLGGVSKPSGTLYKNNKKIDHKGSITLDSDVSFRYERSYKKKSFVSKTITIHVVDSLPKIKISGNDENTWYNTNKTITAEITNSSGFGVRSYKVSPSFHYELLVDNTNNKTLDITVDKEGENKLVITGTDNLNNTKTEQTIVKIDKTLPSLKFENNENDNWVHDSKTIVLLASDTYSGVNKTTPYYYQYSLDGTTLISTNKNSAISVEDTNNAKEKRIKFNVSKEGAYTYKFFVSDNAGNVASISKIIKIDNKAPTIKFEGFDSGWNTETGGKKVTITVEDVTSGIKSVIFKIDGVSKTITENAGGTSNKKVYNYTFNDDEIHSVYVEVKDNAGLSTANTAQLMKDSTAPSIKVSQIGSEKEWYNTDVSFDIEIQDTVSGIDTVTIKHFLDGKEVNDNSVFVLDTVLTEENRDRNIIIKENKRITLKNNGVHKFTISSKDNAGNATGEKTYIVKIDQGLPESFACQAEYPADIKKYRDVYLGQNNTEKSFYGNIKNLVFTITENVKIFKDNNNTFECSSNIKKLEIAENKTNKIWLPVKQVSADTETQSMSVKKTYKYSYDVTGLLEKSGQEFAIKITDEAGNEKTDVITLNIDRTVGSPTVEQINIKGSSNNICFNEKQDRYITIGNSSNEEISVINVYLRKEDIGNFDKAIKEYPGNAKEINLSEFYNNSEGLYRVNVENIDKYGNHASKQLIVAYRGKLDTPVVTQGFELQNGNLLTYIEVQSQDTYSSLDSTSINFLKGYNYFGLQNLYADKSVDRNKVKVITKKNGKYKIYINDIKNEIVDWGSDEEEKRTLGFFFDISTDNKTVKSVDSISNLCEYVVYDTAPQFNNIINSPEFAGKTVHLSSENDNGFSKFAADPDEDTLVYKVTLSENGNTNIVKSYYTLADPTSIDLENHDYQNGLKILIEAKGLRNKTFAEDDISEDDIKAAWEAEPSTKVSSKEFNYTVDKIDFTNPEIICNEPDYWNNKTIWTSKYKSDFTITDKESGINTIKVRYYEDNKPESPIYEESINGNNSKTVNYTADFSKASSDFTGKYYIEFDISDAAGNTVTAQIFGPILLDTKAPVINEVIAKNSENGDVTLQIIADDNNGSGIKQYCWKLKDSEDWSTWQNYSTEVCLALSNYLPNREISLKLRDKALNESSAKTVSCQEYALVPEITEFTMAGVNKHGYVTVLPELLPRVTFKDNSLLDNYTCTWKLVEDEKDVSVYEDFEELKQHLREAKNNHVQLTVKNKFGHSRTKECDIDFRIELTPPDGMEIRTLGTPYAGVPVEVYIKGGLDTSCPVARYVYLVDRNDNNNEKVLTKEKVDSNANEGTVKLAVSLYEEEINTGNVYIIAESVNAAGLITKSSNVIKLTLEESKGLIVTAKDYTSGDINVSWKSSNDEITEYEYQLISVTGKVIQSGLTDKMFTVLSLNAEEITDTVFYVDVKGFKNNTIVAEGKSNSITFTKEYPDAEWIDVPVAALSKNVWANYSVNYNQIPITEICWTYEIYEYNEEEKEWQWKENNNWFKETVSSGKLSIDLSDEKESKQITDGSLVRFILSGENKAGLETQVMTNGIIIDDTAPPIPIVLDQGDVVNQVREESLKIDWSTSFNDPESGSTYYWRWYLTGKYNQSEEWILAEKSVDEISQILKAELTNINDQKYDGCILYFEVKAVNGAGTESIGRTNGILLDSNAPIIDNIRIFTDESRKINSEISGYTNINKIKNDIYVGIEVSDETSWLNNAVGFLYNKLENGDELREDSCIFEIMPEYAISQMTLKEIIEGKRFFVQARAEDAAGNRTGSAISDCILITGELAGIKQITLQGDTKRLNANWVIEGNAKWIKYYDITYTYELNGNSYNYKKYSTVNSYSVTWEDIGLDIDGSLPEAIYVDITPVGYDYSTGITVRNEIEIDLSIPNIVEQRIPFEARLISWADKITGYTSYQSGRTGTSLVEWASIFAKDGASLTDWVKKRNSSSITISKDINELIPGREDSFWQNQYLILKFRAMNGMGLSSPEKICTPVMIDLTPADVLSIVREWGWSNAVTEIDSINVTAGDKDTGIISCISGLVRKDDVIERGIENVLQSQIIEEIDPMIPFNELLIQNNKKINIIEQGEGVYVAVIGARNGSGLWTYAQSPEIVIDRTSPKIQDEDFEGVYKKTEILEDTEIESYIFNGPIQQYNVTANEPVLWIIKIDDNEIVDLSENVYKETTINEMNFLGKEEGKVYVVTFEMTDKAGNTGREIKYLRYNKSPSINVKYDPDTDNKIIVWPGHSKTISELVEVFEDEELSDGDYPYTFEWDGGNGITLTWTGGLNSNSVLVPNGDFPTAYYQDGKAQITNYNAKLKVADRYGKERITEFVITVENTRKGELLVDEYWTGNHKITGEIIVPDGKKLTAENILITVDGIAAETLIESGFNISGEMECLGNVEIKSHNPLLNWKGIMINGNLKASRMDISGALRAFTLLEPCNIHIDNLNITNCITGLHLFGGTFVTNNLSISYCTQYGIKIESEGNYDYGNLDLYKNGKNIYHNGITN